MQNGVRIRKAPLVTSVYLLLKMIMRTKYYSALFQIIKHFFSGLYPMNFRTVLSWIPVYTAQDLLRCRLCETPAPPMY